MIFFKQTKIIPKLNIWANGNQIDEVKIYYKSTHCDEVSVIEESRRVT